MTKKASPKKRSAVKVPRKFTFRSRDNSTEQVMDAPVEGNKASKVLFHVLNTGKAVPEGVKLQWAESYKAHFIALKGKNACGASSNPNILVVNGIAKELEAAGVEGIVQPTSKAYKAINVKAMDAKQLKALAREIATVLGFGRKVKKVAAKAAKKPAIVDVVAEDAADLA
jgi:hypothetical protein